MDTTPAQQLPQVRSKIGVKNDNGSYNDAYDAMDPPTKPKRRSSSSLEGGYDLDPAAPVGWPPSRSSSSPRPTSPKLKDPRKSEPPRRSVYTDPYSVGEGPLRSTSPIMPEILESDHLDYDGRPHSIQLQASNYQ